MKNDSGTASLTPIIAHDACRASQESGGLGPNLSWGNINYRGETDCRKRPRYLQLKTSTTVVIKEDFQEPLKF